MHFGFHGMKKTAGLFVLLCVSVIFPITGWTYEVVGHQFQIKLVPQDSRIEVKDTIEVPKQWQGKTIQFILNGDLSIDATAEDITQIPLSGPYKSAASDYEIPLKQYRLVLKPGQNRFDLQYQGRINHPIRRAGEEYDRSSAETPGLIDPKGVFLANSTVWYPIIDSTLVTFTMQVNVPGKWSVVTQGRRTSFHRHKQGNDISWQEHNPQDDIYLVANRFIEYSHQAGKVQAMVFLREKDDALAQKYLDATQQYISMYSRLLGPYLYSKFALVENFWDTGYGMPSFTLLGPKVIRFTFIFCIIGGETACLWVMIPATGPKA
jgi:aminopeptidase N